MNAHVSTWYQTEQKIVQQMFTLTSPPLCLFKAMSQGRMSAKGFVHVWIERYMDMRERERRVAWKEMLSL